MMNGPPAKPRRNGGSKSRRGGRYKERVMQTSSYRDWENQTENQIQWEKFDDP